MIIRVDSYAISIPIKPLRQYSNAGVGATPNRIFGVRKSQGGVL